MDLGSIVVRSKKIRIYPKKNSRIKEFIGLSRYWYNCTVAYLKQKGTKASLFDLRKILQDRENHENWAFKCPQRIREHAIKKACKAVSNAKVKYLKQKQSQEVKFKKKKDLMQWFGFDKISLKQNFVFCGKNKIEFRATERLNVDLEGTEIIQENGRWFVIIPQKRTVKKPENQRFGTVSLDPGVRTFVAYYSEFFHGKIGEGDFNRIFRLCLNIDKMISRMSQCKSKERRSLKKVAQRLRWKIRNLIDDLHKKTASFLVKNFDKILIPTFETKHILQKLKNKTTRNLLNFAHYRFKQFLKCKAEEYSCEVVEVSEAWTSRTCSYCGKIHPKNSKKTLKCDCGAIVDRDLNGARGIYLRALVASPFQPLG